MDFTLWFYLTAASFWRAITPCPDARRAGGNTQCKIQSLVNSEHCRRGVVTFMFLMVVSV